MITSKQRSYLRSLAHNIDPLVYIGKQGVTENVVKELDLCLEAYMDMLTEQAAK